MLTLAGALIPSLARPPSIDTTIICTVPCGNSRINVSSGFLVNTSMTTPFLFGAVKMIIAFGSRQSSIPRAWATAILNNRRYSQEKHSYCAIIFK